MSVELLVCESVLMNVGLADYFASCDRSINRKFPVLGKCCVFLNLCDYVTVT